MSAEAFFESEHVKYIRHLHINGFDYVIYKTCRLCALTKKNLLYLHTSNFILGQHMYYIYSFDKLGASLWSNVKTLLH